jgi:hypothetical protein
MAVRVSNASCEENNARGRQEARGVSEHEAGPTSGWSDAHGRFGDAGDENGRSAQLPRVGAPLMLRPVCGFEDLDCVGELPIASLVPDDLVDRVGVVGPGSSAHQHHPVSGIARDFGAHEESVPQRHLSTDFRRGEIRKEIEG